MLPDHLQKFATPQPVLNGQGHIVLIDVMGDDARVADAARTSYQSNAALREARDTGEDATLIRQLLRDRHTNPFEHAHLTLHVRCPMDVWRLWIWHQTASVSEYSTRYKEAIDDALKTDPDTWRSQSKNNKQGSAGWVTEWPEGYRVEKDDYMEFVSTPGGGRINVANVGQYLSLREMFLQHKAREVYEERLAFGIAREQARKDLPLSTMTEAVWTIDLHNLFHFLSLSLRLDPHAQQEIREYATVITQIVEAWCPATWAAFKDWRLEAVTFSGPEIRSLRALLGEISNETNAREISAIGVRDALYKGEIYPSELLDFLRKLGLETP